jgi:putative transposase
MYELHLQEPEKSPQPKASEIDKQFNSIKKAAYPWLYDKQGKMELPNCVAQEAIKVDLKKAFDNFFRRVKQGGVPGYPKKKKKGINDSFRLTNIFIKSEHIIGDKLIMPKKMGTATLGDTPRFTGKLMSSTISYKGGKWWVSFAFEVEENLKPPAPEVVVGIDVGVAQFAALSDGTVYEPTNALQRHEKKLKRLQRQLAKQEKGSNNRVKRKAQIAKLHKHIADIRKDKTHQVTAELTRNYQTIVIEDLNVKNMTGSAKGDMENPGKKVKQKAGLNRSILNQGWYEFRRQLEYKTKWHGGQVIAVNPRYTSQTCFKCGHVAKENRVSQEVFKCVKCGYTANADFNAAQNIKQRGMKQK